MNLQEVMNYLKSKGSDQTRKIYSRHGAPENSFGVKVGDMKPIEKQERNNHSLAQELYATGNGDAQYLAGLIASPSHFAKEDLEKWAKDATWYMVSEYAVAWNLAEHPNCAEIATEWIHSEDSRLQVVGWAGYAGFLRTKKSEGHDVEAVKTLLSKAEKEIHGAENRVRYNMNGFIIAAGGAYPELTEECKSIGDRIGEVKVDLGQTACKVPSIRPYIENMEKRNRIGKKKVKAKC
ncbi:MAG: DNA alkylation repair protein [Fluviicola sp. XM-24bin1]|nr:MAG: DNA alkylation repair protein [Fluviicola sp. XM-24bin1]